MSEDKLRQGTQTGFPSISQSTQVPIKKTKPNQPEARAFRTNHFKASVSVLVTFMEVEKLQGDAEERLWRTVNNTSYRRKEDTFLNIPKTRRHLNSDMLYPICLTDTFPLLKFCLRLQSEDVP